jgi:predicted small lipoprotein YifL
MKKAFALLLAVLTVVLAACGSKPEPYATPDTPAATADEATQPTTEATEPPTTTTLANDRFDPEASAALIGTWYTTITLGGSLFNMDDMTESVQMKMVYQLNADGTCYRGVPEEEYHAAISAYAAAVENYMLDRLYAKFTAEKLLEGVGKKKIPTLWEESGKADAQEQAQRFVDGLYLDYRFSQINSKGDYYEADGFLWFSGEDGSYEPCGYTLSEAGLTVTEVENPKIYKQLGLALPLVLTKAQ